MKGVPTMLYRRLSAPITCQVELTTACDNSCIHCYNHWRHETDISHEVMSVSLLGTVVDELLKNDVFQVSLTGGEPLLCKGRLFAGVEKLVAGGISCTVNSNLTRLTSQDACALHRLGLHGILTSVCASTAELHDHITRQEGSFVKTICGIGNATHAGIEVGVSMVVTQLNKDEVIKTALMLKAIGVSQFYATKASPPLNACEFEKYMITQEELLLVMESLAELRDVHGMSVGILECYPLCGYADQRRYGFAAGRRCSAGVTTCTISAKGEVRPCSHSDEVFGNIAEDGLLKTWSAMDDWRNGSKLPQTCRECKFLAMCSGGCRVDAKYRSGKYNTMEPYAEPDRVALVKLAKPETMLLKPKCRMVVNPNLRARREEFGIFVADLTKVNSPALITQATYELVEVLKSGEFNAEKVAELTMLDVASSLKLCHGFIRDGIFLLPKEEMTEPSAL
jgi:radical SAM protein with 4Fe4S-binding SPASM domain